MLVVGSWLFEKNNVTYFLEQPTTHNPQPTSNILVAAEGRLGNMDRDWWSVLWK